MGKIIKTTIDGVPVELELIRVGPATTDALTNLSDNLGAEVLVSDGNGGKKASPIVNNDQTVRVVSVGNEKVPATTADVTKVSNAVSSADAGTLISNLANSIENVPEGIEFWQSRTFWVNAIAIVASLSAYFGFDFKSHNINQESVITIITTVLGLVNVYLRTSSNNIPVKSVTGSIKTFTSNLIKK